MYMTLSFSYFLCQNLVQFNNGSQRIHITQRHSWALLLTLSWIWIMNSRVMVHDMKDIGDIVDSPIHSFYSHTHLFESWNKLLEVVKDSSKRLEGTLSKGTEELSKLNLEFTLNLNYFFKVMVNFMKDL